VYGANNSNPTPYLPIINNVDVVSAIVTPLCHTTTTNFDHDARCRNLCERFLNTMQDTMKLFLLAAAALLLSSSFKEVSAVSSNRIMKDDKEQASSRIVGGNEVKDGKYPFFGTFVKAFD